MVNLYLVDHVQNKMKPTINVQYPFHITVKIAMAIYYVNFVINICQPEVKTVWSQHLISVAAFVVLSRVMLTGVARTDPETQSYTSSVVIPPQKEKVAAFVYCFCLDISNIASWLKSIDSIQVKEEGHLNIQEIEDLLQFLRETGTSWNEAWSICLTFINENYYRTRKKNSNP